MAKVETIRINDYLAERKRTTKSGTKSHFTVEIKSEPLEVTVDELALGTGIAAAIREVIASQIKSVSATVSPTTQLFRKYARDAFLANKPWAKRRYSGGRTGDTPPAQTDRMFNDSQRLANNLALRANATEKAFTINAPANRFDERTFSVRGEFVRMMDRLRSYVPALRDPAFVLGDPRVREAIRETIQKVLVNKADKSRELRKELAKTAWDFARQLVGIGDEIAESSEG